MNDTRAILWDLDGTLIDSMPAHVRAWKEILTDVGIAVDDLYIQLHEGEKAEVTIARLAQENGFDWPAERLAEVIRMKRERYRSISPHGLIPEARQVIEELNALGIQNSIVTGSVRANMNGVVPMEEQSLFRYIITADDYEHGKPLPDPYNIAVTQSGFDREQCLAVENAPLGIQSAKAAGLRTIAVTTTLPAEYLHEADIIISRYGEIKGLL